MRTAAILIDLAVALTTVIIVLGMLRKDGHFSRKRLKAFRFFTVDSNVFSGLGCLAAALCLLCGAETLPRWALLLRYTGTVSVAVTFLTVMVFLGPAFGYGKMLSGGDLYLHLLGPLAAVVSFVLAEPGARLIGADVLYGLLPTVIYGTVYLYQVVIRPTNKWEDFYTFNRGGKWPVAFAAMVLGTLLICMFLCAARNALH